MLSKSVEQRVVATRSYSVKDREAGSAVIAVLGALLKIVMRGYPREGKTNAQKASGDAAQHMDAYSISLVAPVGGFLRKTFTSQPEVHQNFARVLEIL